jgi:hypothetical protein
VLGDALDRTPAGDTYHVVEIRATRADIAQALRSLEPAPPQAQPEPPRARPTVTIDGHTVEYDGSSGLQKHYRGPFGGSDDGGRI